MRGSLVPQEGYAQRLVLMVKAPKAGRAKTRLAKSVGKARAASFYRHATATLVNRLGRDKRWQTILAVDPISAIYKAWASVWPPHLQRLTQGTGDLGDRMGLQVDALPPGPVVIIGSDSPHVSKELIQKAFERLRGSDAVIGPAPDGGYWLIGFRRFRPAPELFKNVRWSTEHTLADTLETLPDNFRVSYLPVLTDVDEGEDLATNPGILIRSNPYKMAT